MNDADNWPPDEGKASERPDADVRLSAGCLVFAVASWGLLV